MPEIEGQGNPEADAQLASLSQNITEMDGGRKNMSEADQKALDDLIVERKQVIARSQGELAGQADVEPVEVEGAMVEHSGTWESKEQQQ